MSEAKKIKLLGMDLKYFLVLFVIITLAMYFEFLPASLAGQIPLLLVYGEALRYIGDRCELQNQRS